MFLSWTNRKRIAVITKCKCSWVFMSVQNLNVGFLEIHCRSGNMFPHSRGLWIETFPFCTCEPSSSHKCCSFATNIQCCSDYLRLEFPATWDTFGPWLAVWKVIPWIRVSPVIVLGGFLWPLFLEKGLWGKGQIGSNIRGMISVTKFIPNSIIK